MGRLIWKWEDEEEDGEGIGPYWIDDGGQSETWIRRSEAARSAREDGHEFIPDE